MGVQILDCTLRDGGYYCDWDFDDRTVRRYVDAVGNSGIEYVEIGFRSLPGEGFAGKYKFSRDSMIRELFKDSRVRIAVMIDGKEFIKGEEIHKDNLLKLLRPKVESRVDLVRITATHNTLRPVLKIAQLVGSLGYAVAVNVMQSSLLSADAARNAALA